MIFGQKSESYFLLFSAKQVRKKVFCDVFDRKLSILNQKNVAFKKSKNWYFSKGVSPRFLMKNWKCYPFCFLAKTVQNKVFCDPEDRNLQNMDLKKSKSLHFSKGVSPRFLMKNWKFCPFCFSAKESKRNCQVTLQIEIQPFKTTKQGFKNVEYFAFFQRGLSTVFDENMEILSFLFFSKIVSKCFLTLQIEIQPFKAQKISI